MPWHPASPWTHTCPEAWLAAPAAHHATVHPTFQPVSSTSLPSFSPPHLQTVAENLAAQLCDLRYGHKVQRIAWGPGGVRIRCANGATLEAAAAVVTLPLGVLQARHGELFEPALPPGKVGGLAPSSGMLCLCSRAAT